ncbi:hypothetical protein [Actinospica sp.]|jgi:hypothetical protein|uniref:hypothetical protein n=1 Tax=Actinospica sp. TaxID=1872142 RepID=UPI002C9855F8|nr:hypothetical protein [Actinospica sp.]HWG28495.1 hypothetical protein [Actinospica sp.]
MRFRERGRHSAATSTQRTAQSSNTSAAQRLAIRELRRPRGAVLLDAVRRLDAGLDEQACRALAEQISAQYAKDFGGGVPIGLLATCYLGAPYVDHRLNLIELIVEHYTPGSAVPDPYAAARPLVRSGAYAYVEVYSDGLIVPVLPDGSPVVG